MVHERAAGAGHCGGGGIEVVEEEDHQKIQQRHDSSHARGKRWVLGVGFIVSLAV